MLAAAAVAPVKSTVAAAVVAAVPSPFAYSPPPATSTLPGAYITVEPDTRGLKGRVPIACTAPVPAVDSDQRWSPEMPTTVPFGPL